MMIIPEGYANVRLVFAVDGITREQGCSFGVDARSISFDASEIAELVSDTMPLCDLGQATQITGGWTWHGVDVAKTVGGFPQLGQKRFPIVGTASGDSPPCNSALLLTKNTASGGRRQRGRMYVPPYQLDDLSVDSAGFIGEASQNQANDRWNSLRTQIETAGLELMLFHSHADDLPTRITSFTVSTQLATQRRRMR